MQRVDNKAGQAVIKERTQKVEMKVSGSLKTYFYFCRVRGQRQDFLIELIESLQRVLNGEWREQDLSVRAEDTAIVLVLGNIDADVDHNQILLIVY